MPGFLKTLPLLAALALTGPAFAQDTTTTPPAEADAPAETLSMGEDVQVEPYVRETSGDWSLECIRTGTDEEPCQLFQALNDADGNQVANIRIFRLKEGGQAEAGALVAVPLETLLTSKLTIAVDGAKGKRYDFSVCDRLGCYARVGLTSEDIASFKRGAKATVSLVPFVAPDQKVMLDLSLKGFTAGYEEVSVVNAQ
ncbi:invasion associated locus B family protein [Thalassovita taeanensis]|uniref:Invasion protein IalB, involved in pathogenesis n=1 Tax=Thalassovita taeanensis TaxID=657014 RepID=A0A1H8Z283_9RHOB|nr:invasion associated locus B family protein [Thalassovita taeanensis]SEP58530.1 Invasion protein IalB, involved in pathogenesis [Thalassovita taeanensis]